MDEFKKGKNMVLKLLGFLFIFHTSLFAVVGSVTDVGEESGYSTQIEGKQKVLEHEGTREVSLDSFGEVSIVLMMVFTSLLGTFFVKDELSGSF